MLFKLCLLIVLCFKFALQNQPLIVSKNPPIKNGCVSKYIEEDNDIPNQLAKEAMEFLNNHAEAMNLPFRYPKDHANFLEVVKNKYYNSLAQPGEPVGIIAAQSVGEPSTQMT